MPNGGGIKEEGNDLDNLEAGFIRLLGFRVLGSFGFVCPAFHVSWRISESLYQLAIITWHRISSHVHTFGTMSTD